MLLMLYASYVEKRAAKLGRFFHAEQEVLVNVTFKVGRKIHVAEVTMDLKGLVLRGEGKTSDMYASIDTAFERIGDALGSLGSKIQKNSGAKLSQMPAQTEEDAVQEVKELKIVRTKRFCAKTNGCRRSNYANGITWS